MLVDVVAVTVAAVLVNHLGLIEAVERAVRHKLSVLNCPKCLACWSVLAVLVFQSGETALRCAPVIVATSLLAAFAAKWVELLFGYFDTVYDKIYDKIYQQGETDDKEGSDSADTVHSQADVP
jgi:flagellar biosynthesis protein FliQ